LIDEIAGYIEELKADYQKICDEKRQVEIGLAQMSVLNEKLKTGLEAKKGE